MKIGRVILSFLPMPGDLKGRNSPLPDGSGGEKPTGTAVLVGGEASRLGAVAAVILVCVIIKWFFAEADAQRLDWLLKPTSLLAGYFSGLSFVAWPGEGYYNADEGLFLVAACSGFNFLIILLATGGSLLVWHWPDFLKRLSGLTAWVTSLPKW